MAEHGARAEMCSSSMSIRGARARDCVLLLWGGEEVGLVNIKSGEQHTFFLGFFRTPWYWMDETVDVAVFGPGPSPITIDSTRLELSQGSPPSPLYRFKVVNCNSSGNCNLRASTDIQVVDIALYEPKVTFFGDLDPKTRVLMGQITVRAPAKGAMGLQGYRAYPTNDGNNNLPLQWSDTFGPNTDHAQFALNLDKSCPPGPKNTDWDRADDWQAHARAPCGNDSPYSPKCLGKSCPYVNILPGSSGEFYIR